MSSASLAISQSLLFKLKDKPAVNLYDVPLASIKTQKARGVRSLGMRGFSGVSSPDLHEIYLLPQNLPWLSKHPTLIYTSNWFARPCPVTPRHGFVESRPVQTLEQAIAVFDEARLEDPEAELLLMKKYSGRYSGIATNVGVTWGFGNDGVTASKGNTYNIPTPSADKDSWNEMFSGYISLEDITGVGYIELVEHAGNVCAVQFRDGPQLPTTQDFIPRKTKVTEVLWEESDLLAWEKTLKAKRDKKGLVVQLKKGTALSSHAAVHAIALGIPAINSHHIEVGATLIPTLNRPKPLRKGDYFLLREKLQKNEIYKTGNGDVNQLLTSIATIHAMSAWDNTPHLLALRAYAIPTLIRYMASACYGEMRHWNDNGPGKNGDSYTTVFTRGTKGGTTRWESEELTLVDLSRDQVYRTAFDYSFPKLTSGFRTMIEDFNNKNWKPRPKTPPLGLSERRMRQWWKKQRRKGYAYGGPKWGEVAASGLALINAYNRFILHPNAGNWSDIIIAANNAIHTAHNGGFALSKWLNDKDFHRIAVAPAYGLTNSIAASITLSLGAH